MVRESKLEKTEHGLADVSVEEDTTDPRVAYAPIPRREPTAYRDVWLPE
jgi:hypothetical protein